jgi:hypothetical protein
MPTAGIAVHSGTEAKNIRSRLARRRPPARRPYPGYELRFSKIIAAIDEE